MWLVVFNDIKAAVLVQIHTPKPMVCWSRMIKYKSVILTHLCKSDFAWITAQLYEVLAGMRAGRCSSVCAGAVPPGAKCPRLSMAIHFTSTGYHECTLQPDSRVLLSVDPQCGTPLPALHDISVCPLNTFKQKPKTRLFGKR